MHSATLQLYTLMLLLLNTFADVYDSTNDTNITAADAVQIRLQEYVIANLRPELSWTVISQNAWSSHIFSFCEFSITTVHSFATDLLIWDAAFWIQFCCMS